MGLEVHRTRGQCDLSNGNVCVRTEEVGTRHLVLPGISGKWTDCGRVISVTLRL